MRAELEGWYRFTRAQSHVLHRPQRLFQLAMNEPDSSPIAKSAAERLRNKRETRPWLRWINKPQEQNPCLVTLTGGGRKSGFAFSPDSTRIVTGWDDESMQVWNAQTGQLLVQLPCLTTPKYERDLTVMGCAFVADGKRIVTYVEDDSLKLWDAETGEEVAWLARHGEGAKTWCASPDGRRIAAWSWNTNDVKIWDSATGELVRTLHCDGEPLFGPMTFSSDNLFLARGSGTIQIWTHDIGAPVSSLSLGLVESIEFSPDETCLLTSDNFSGSAKLWHFFTGELLASFKGHTERLSACHISPDGTRVVTASWDKTLKLWSIDGTELSTFQGHSGHVKDCAFSPDSRLLVSASDDQTLKLWDCEDGALLATFVGHARSVAACAFSPDGKLVVSTSSESTRIWDASARTTAIEAHDRIRGCVFSEDGTKVVIDESQVIDIANGKSLGQWNQTAPSFDLHTPSYAEISEWDPVQTQLRLSVDSEYLMGVVDQQLKVIAADSGGVVRVICDKAPATFCVSPDGRKVVCSILNDSFDQSIRCFDAFTGAEKFATTIARVYGNKTQLRFSHDSRIAVVLTDAATLVFIDTESGAIISEFLHHERVAAFDASPTENLVIAGGELGSLFILRLENLN